MEFVCKPNMALHLKRGIRPNVVLKEHICAFGQKTNLRGENEEKLGQGENIKIVGVISSHSLLLSDQASWVKKIQRDLR